MSNAGSELDLIKRDVVDVVADRIRELSESKEIRLPANYSVENAMKSAWLLLQVTTTPDKRPVLTACTKNSIANSLLDMAVQGLNPAKKQCYFVPYGDKLVCMRSYFGSMHVVKQVIPESDIYYALVYEGDDFEYEIERGRKRITLHKQTIANVAAGKILASYCVIEPGGVRPPIAEVMTIAQIKQAWSQGQTYREGGSGVHQKFDDQMALKTVINRACKRVINTSSDDHLFLKHFNHAEEEIAEEEMVAEVAAGANGDVIDIEPSTVTEAPPTSPAPTAEPAKEPTTPPHQSEPEAPAKPASAKESVQATLDDAGPGY